MAEIKIRIKIGRFHSANANHFVTRLNTVEQKAEIRIAYL